MTRNRVRRRHAGVLRVLSLLFLAVFAAQVSGAAELGAAEVFAGDDCADDCAQECAGNGPGMSPPPCAFCHCCLAANVFLPPDPMPLESPSQVLHGALAPEHTPAAAPARDISHVPKAPLA